MKGLLDIVLEKCPANEDRAKRVSGSRFAKTDRHKMHRNFFTPNLRHSNLQQPVNFFRRVVVLCQYNKAECVFVYYNLLFDVTVPI